MSETKLRNLDRAAMWSIAAISLAPLVPYALTGLFA